MSDFEKLFRQMKAMLVKKIKLILCTHDTYRLDVRLGWGDHDILFWCDIYCGAVILKARTVWYIYFRCVDLCSRKHNRTAVIEYFEMCAVITIPFSRPSTLSSENQKNLVMMTHILHPSNIATSRQYGCLGSVIFRHESVSMKWITDRLIMMTQLIAIETIRTNINDDRVLLTCMYSDKLCRCSSQCPCKWQLSNSPHMWSLHCGSVYI